MKKRLPKFQGGKRVAAGKDMMSTVNQYQKVLLQLVHL